MRGGKLEGGKCPRVRAHPTKNDQKNLAPRRLALLYTSTYRASNDDLLSFESTLLC